MFISAGYNIIINLNINGGCMNGGIKRIISVLCAFFLAAMIAGCAIEKSTDAGIVKNSAVDAVQTRSVSLDAAEMFSDRDIDFEYDDGFEIQLADGNVKSSCNTLLIAGDTVTIKDEGTYI